MNKSDSIKNLSEALVKFQGDISNPSNSKTVSAGQFSYKYAPLDEVLNLVRPLLSKYGLSIVQAPLMSDGMVGVSTVLLHQSGEYLEFEPIMLKMDKQSAQGAGSAITYARRYALSAILGISSEDDNDGNGTEFNPKQQAQKNKPQQQKKQQMDKGVDASLASEKQLELIYKLAKEKNYSPESMVSYIKNRFNKDNSKALTMKEASEMIKMLQDIGK